jgi:hypothetical protein
MEEGGEEEEEGGGGRRRRRRSGWSTGAQGQQEDRGCPVEWEQPNRAGRTDPPGETRCSKVKKFNTTFVLNK